MIRRRRWIQPEFFTSEDVLALPIEVRLTFIGLWLYADDYGRERTHAALIKADVWPLDEVITPSVVEGHLVLLAERGLIETYAVAGREYFQITGWAKHQPVDKPSRTNVPPPPAPSAAQEPPQAARESRDPSPTPLASEGGERDEREGREGEEGEGEGRPTPAPPASDTEPASRPPSPFCDRHPDGTSKPCRDCGTARMRRRKWQDEHENDDHEEAA